MIPLNFVSPMPGAIGVKSLCPMSRLAVSFALMSEWGLELFAVGAVWSANHFRFASFAMR